MSREFIKNIHIKPVAVDDVDYLLDMVKKSAGGLSSLQPRRAFLKEYIEASQESFSGKKSPELPHKYLLGMYHDDRLIGCAAVKTQIGRDTPFINFDLTGDGLDQYLVASSRFTGATEVGSLFLHPDYREYGLGKYLAKVRYLLMSVEPWRFGDTIIAELRGICGAEGSPLYDHLFKDKLEKTFLQADNEYFDRNPDALGEIVPIGRVDVSSFPLEVRASLAQPHPSGKAALRMLQSEGFIFSGTIDLFDGGPIVCSFRDTIRTILSRQKAEVAPVTSVSGGSPHLICAGKVSDFRAVVCSAKSGDGHLLIPEQDFEKLSLKPGESVYYWASNAKIMNTRKSLVKSHL